MGLDNGIVIKNVDNTIINSIPWYVKFTVFERENEVEIAYWRKWYAFRDRVLYMLRDQKYISPCEYVVTPECLKEIIEELYTYFDYDVYTDTDHYWAFDDAVTQLGRNIPNLLWLSRFWEENPDIDVRFYDSY